MIININYGNKVAVIPASAIAHLNEASLNDLKTLVAISSESSNENVDLKAVADKVGLDLGDFIVSLNFLTFWSIASKLLPTSKINHLLFYFLLESLINSCIHIL